MNTATYRTVRSGDGEAVERRTKSDGLHAVAIGECEVTAWSDGRTAHSIALGYAPRWITLEDPSSEGADDAGRDSGLYARTTGVQSAAVAIGRANTAESSGYCSPAVALDTTTCERDTVAAITYDSDSPAFAFGRPSSRLRVTADSMGAESHAVAIGGDAHALASGDESHTIVLANSLAWQVHGQTAEASGRWAYAIAPTGTAHSERYISIGLRVVLESEASVGVILPPPYTDLRPVVVDGHSHPTGVALTLDAEGGVIEAREA